MERTQKITSHNKTRPPHIDGLSHPEQVAEHFGNKYETLYNCVLSDLESVKREISRSIHGDSDAEFQLDEIIIDKAIQELKSEKLDGDKGLCSNRVIKSLCSLPKHKVGDVCNSENYRSIALTSCVNKVLDWVILI